MSKNTSIGMIGGNDRRSPSDSHAECELYELPNKPTLFEISTDTLVRMSEAYKAVVPLQILPYH